MQTTEIGNKGEQLAAEALVKLGYEIIDRNWKTKFAEIDIIARKKDTVYFVEVKFRSSDRQGDGFDYITDLKLHHMQRAAELWTAIKGWKNEIMLLAVAVDSNGNTDIREIS